MQGKSREDKDMHEMSQEDKDEELLSASMTGDVAAINALIESNADVNATDEVRRVMCVCVRERGMEGEGQRHR